MAISLKGTARTRDHVPVENASVYLVASAELLHGLGDAAVRRPGAVSWTRTITGLSGSRWNGWQQHVMNVVSGITWDEFKVQVVAYNPGLEADDSQFQPEKTYLLPEQASGDPVVLWSRPLAGFYGTRWSCWETYVQGKVEGITWNEFVDAVLEFNPALREDGNVFQESKTYWLPENPPDPDQVSWTRSCSGLTGNRWECWEAHVRDQVQGITWAAFRDGAVEHNPVLREDGYVFVEGKTYLLPENPATAFYYLYATTDSKGQFAFLALPEACEPTGCDGVLTILAEGCFPYHERLSLQADLDLDVTLVAQGARMVSLWEGYATASATVRRLIDQALSMLGDDPVVYDTLPAELRRLATGSYYADPDHLWHKDIVCADLVSICLRAAGVDFRWEVVEPPRTKYIYTHSANYYRPRTGHPKLRIVDEGEEWLPGDILIYWNGDLQAKRIKHVNLYVGPYSGTDHNGTVHPASEGYDVVNASIDYIVGGIEYGTVISPATQADCTDDRFSYQHFLRMRHVELEHEHSLRISHEEREVTASELHAAEPAASTTGLQGKGIWAYRRWELERAIEIAPRLGATHVIYKVARGAAYRDEMPEVVQAIRTAGLVPLAYTYTLLDDPRGEAEVVARAFRDGFEGVIFDLEADRCRNRFEQATYLGQLLRDAGTDLRRIYNCSFPSISYHRALPYDQFNEFCKGGLMPMSYGTFFPPGSTASFEEQAERVIHEWTYGHYEFWTERWGYRPPLYPVLGPYHDLHGTVRMSAQEFQVWLDALALHAPSFFSVFTAAVIDEELLPLIQDLDVVRPPDPARMRVQVESPESGYLRIRRTDSTEQPPLTRVEHKALLACLEPEEDVRAKVGQPEKWLHIVTPNGIEGYAYALYLRLRETAVAPPVKLKPVGPLNVRPEPSTARPPMTQVDQDDVLEALEPAAEVMARVGQPGQWLFIRTPEGIEGYVSAEYVRLYEEPVTTIFTHLTVRSSSGLYVRSGPEMGAKAIWQVGNRTVLQALEEPEVVASKVGQDRWIHVCTPSLHKGYVNGLYVRPMDKFDNRKRIRPAKVRPEESPYLFGLHASEPGAAPIKDFQTPFVEGQRAGWVLFLEGVGTDPTHIRKHDFTPWSARGLGVMMRLDNGWNKAGTLPTSDRYEGFADTCARYVDLAEGCHIWIIGNEQNNVREHPGGEEDPQELITPERYAKAFNMVRKRIKDVRPDAIVVPGAVDPYNISLWLRLGRYTPLEYFKEMMARIDDLDGIALHTYTQWLDPKMITSLQPFTDPPLIAGTPDEHYYHFQAYRAFAEAIPAKWHDRPIYITEANHWRKATQFQPNAEKGWLNENRGWVREAYAEIERWNSSPYAQQIHCLLLYRWQDDEWAFGLLGQVKEDFTQAMAQDYRWRR